MAMTLDGSNGVTFNDSSLQGAAASPFGLKNRIINGDMRIDQRNAGASVTNSAGATTYTLDRWALYGSQASKFTVQQNAGSVTPPVGFTNYLGVTSLSAYSVGASELFIINQRIEGYNIADLAWGTADAKTITISFWVRSSLTGTFGGVLQNSAQNRNYPFSYSISSANTWEQKTITVAGDTSGTWLTTNGIGFRVSFSIGVGSTLSGTASSWSATEYYSATGATSVVGTNGATWYVTGVQLEIGSTATPFERRLYGTELAHCQRYYWKTYAQSTVPGTNTDTNLYSSTLINFSNGTGFVEQYGIPTSVVTMRAAPTISYWDRLGNASKASYYGSGTFTSNLSLTLNGIAERSFAVYTDGSTSKGGFAFHWVSSAEL
jgi:hypothetical protein